VSAGVRLYLTAFWVINQQAIACCFCFIVAKPSLHEYYGMEIIKEGRR